jgi:hypothetical protein
MATSRPPNKRVREGRDGILDVPLRNRDHDIWRRAAVRLSRSIRNPCQRIKLIQPMTTASAPIRLTGQHCPSEIIGFCPLSRSFSTIKFPHGSTKRAYPHCARTGLFRFVAILIGGVVLSLQRPTPVVSAFIRAGRSKLAAAAARLFGNASAAAIRATGLERCLAKLENHVGKLQQKLVFVMG